MNEAWSEHIHTTASAISIGFPNRPIGWHPTAYLRAAGTRRVRSDIGVSTNAGHTAFTRIPALAVSSAAVFVNPITPCLLALYAETPAEPTIPKTEAIFTIAPPLPCFSIRRISYFRHRHTPLRLIQMV